ncbi:class I SAM-dependent methyltransferase [bacterium]|nr:MAG: class I SAM-dependent methyltransferase [bacterium]
MPSVIKRFANRLKQEGFVTTVKKLPHLVSVKIRFWFRDQKPGFYTRFGTSYRKWFKTQQDHELNFWNDPLKTYPLDGFPNLREKLFHLNKDMFNNLILNFPEGKIADIGCGPELGFLPYANAKFKIGIDPLANEYQKKYKFENDILMISALAETIPLCSGSLDAIYCINALDHMYRPYKALDEMYRVLKPGGYFALAVDIGGTKKHPVKIMEADMDRWFANHSFKIIEKSCMSKTGDRWSGVPLYVFQGYKQ